MMSIKKGRNIPRDELPDLERTGNVRESTVEFSQTGFENGSANYAVSSSYGHMSFTKH